MTAAPFPASAPEGTGCLSVYPLRGERVLLFPVGPEHSDAIIAQANDPLVSRYMRRMPYPYLQADANSFIAESQALARDDKAVTLAIVKRSDQTFMGIVGLDRDPDDPTMAELGYWLGQTYWGKGLAREAARLMLEHAFNDLGLRRVVAGATKENVASARIQASLGFTDTHVATCDAPTRPDGSITCHMRSVTAEAFRTATARRMLLVTAVALLDADNRVLLQKRPEGKALAGLWEFPGGKVDPGETPERALVRELQEELGIDIRESCLAPLTFASHAYEDFHLLMPLYVCRQWKGRVTAREGQELAWVRSAKLGDYPMPPADIPLIPILRDWL